MKSDSAGQNQLTLSLLRKSRLKQVITRKIMISFCKEFSSGAFCYAQLEQHLQHIKDIFFSELMGTIGPRLDDST